MLRGRQPAAAKQMLVRHERIQQTVPLILDAMNGFFYARLPIEQA